MVQRAWKGHNWRCWTAMQSAVTVLLPLFITEFLTPCDNVNSRVKLTMVYVFKKCLSCMESTSSLPFLKNSYIVRCPERGELRLRLHIYFSLFSFFGFCFSIYVFVSQMFSFFRFSTGILKMLVIRLCMLCPLLMWSLGWSSKRFMVNGYDFESSP